jgi:hypothetical protein
MYTRAIEEVGDEKVVTFVFDLMHLDYSFPAPTSSRQSGKSTLSDVCLLSHIFLGDINLIVCDKNARNSGEEKTAILWDHNTERTRERKRKIVKLLQKAGMEVKETFNTIYVDRRKAVFDKLPTIPWWIKPILWFYTPVVHESREYENGKVVTYRFEYKVFGDIIYAVKKEIV